MNFEIEYGIDDISKIVKEVISRIPSKSFVFLKGQMGAGKTTLTKEILKQLGVKQTVTSPTFTFVNEYQSDSNIFYHIDCYRIKNIEEAISMGLSEVLESDSWRFVEWAENIAELLPENKVKIILENLELDNRRLTLFTN